MSKIQNADIKSEAELITGGADKSFLPSTNKAYTLKSDSILETVLRKNNFNAIIDPIVTDDVNSNYEVLSRWANTVTDKIFTCIDNSAGAAIWIEGGAGDIQSNFNILQSQPTPLNLTGLIFDKSDIKAVRILVDIFRRSDSSDVKEIGQLWLTLNSETDTWEDPILQSFVGDAGVVFSIDASTGQVKYTSTNLAGASYNGILRLRDITEIKQAAPNSFTINNAQAELNLTDLIFDKSITSAVRIMIDIFRRTDTQDVKETGNLFLSLDIEADAWLDPVVNSFLDDAGVVFTMDASTGQVKYASDDLTGAGYSGILRITDIVRMDI